MFGEIGCEEIMASNSVNVRVTGALYDHMQQQLSNKGGGLYESASEYIRDLIRHDLKEKQDGWQFLQDELEPALSADENEFLAVTADDVIQRNKARLNK
ncbi:MAG: antitoxin ParD1/3/4 [Phenylobacterium sp.]